MVEGIWETYPGSAWSDRGPILGGKAAQGGGASGSRVSVSLKEQEQEQEQGQGQEQGQEVRIEAKVIGRREFYEQRPGFNPLSLLMNPMVLLGVVAMGITFGMPYLMDNSMHAPSYGETLSDPGFPPLLSPPFLTFKHTIFL